MNVQSRIRALVPTFGTVFVSVAAYFVLRRLGFSEIWSLTIPGIASAAMTVANSVRQRRLDTLGALVVLELAITLGLAFTTDDPRIAAIRPAFYTLISGAYFLFTCRVGRPIMYTLATPMATDGGEPVRTRAYEMAWDIPKFRRNSRLMTGIIGVIMLVDSAIRVAVVYHYPASDLDRAFLLSQIAGVVMIVGVIATMVVFVRPGSKVVDGLMAEAHLCAISAPGGH
ncbi:VC0807 family protein [Actinomycetes bacterium M1A6_2h]